MLGLVIYSFMFNGHKRETLVISCIDLRFITKIRDLLVKNRLKGSYNLITIPGASLRLDSIASSILAPLQLHNPNQVYIFDHEDCGAYGKNNSKGLHVRNLKRAKKLF